MTAFRKLKDEVGFTELDDWKIASLIEWIATNNEYWYCHTTNLQPQEFAYNRTRPVIHLHAEC